MAIRCNLAEMMGQRGVTLTELRQRVGLTLANLSILKTNKARAVRFSTLEALCRELECQPGDLFEFVPVPTDQPVREIKHVAPDRRSDEGLPGDYY